MRTPAFDTASPALRHFALFALALCLAGAGQAFAADAMSTVSAPTQQDMHVAAASGAQAGSGRNVDYPSQIGPEGPSSEDATRGGRSLANILPHGGIAPIQPPASR